ncbi:MAG: alpha-glucosidase [Clostridiales Family XIII bacterium]|jgi:oligo-1,6-glucosidase|nr:alpha-glucosidase [Clostridiales Family XIII bacterium]
MDHAMKCTPKRIWWKETVVYQIYPRSFMDADGDGVGDLKGIISRLDYLQALGVGALWFSPIFKSPNDDMGYDISDYRDIMDEFGTLDDFRALLAGAKARGIRVLLDLVANHTSDEHEWFQKSVLREEPYTDYYIWRDPKPDGSEPNNWMSHFAPSAWTYCEERGQYYLHLFSKKQPDLNWENPRVRAEIHAVARYWLDMGVSGFRLDTSNMYSKTPGLPDVPGEGYQWGGRHFMNGPRVHEFIQEMHREVFRHYDCMTVGEAADTSAEDSLLYTGEARGEYGMIIQFEPFDTDRDTENPCWTRAPYDPVRLRDILIHWQEALADDGWNCLCLSNHDQPRPASRFAEGADGARMLAIMLHTLRGTPFVYQGEELGMTNAVFRSMGEYRDISTHNALALLEAREGKGFEEAREVLNHFSRDNARTPMQWTDGAQAGFTAGTPWLKVNENYTEINAEAQRRDPDSVWNCYRQLIALRRAHPCLVYGDFVNLEIGPLPVFCFLRSDGDECFYTLVNLSGGSVDYPLPDAYDRGATRILSNMGEAETTKEKGGRAILRLPPWYAELRCRQTRAATASKNSTVPT